MKLLSWEMTKEEPQDILGDFKNMKISPKSKGLQAKSDGNYVAGLLSLEKLIKVQSGDFL